MRAFAAAALLWSIVVVILLVFDPGFQSTPPCGRLVGRSAECEAAQRAVNDASWWLHRLPLLATVAAGYVAIVLWRIRTLRRRLRGRRAEAGR